jgi:hypothetical protein
MTRKNQSDKEQELSSKKIEHHEVITYLYSSINNEILNELNIAQLQPFGHYSSKKGYPFKQHQFKKRIRKIIQSLP